MGTGEFTGLAVRRGSGRVGFGLGFSVAVGSGLGVSWVGLGSGFTFAFLFVFVLPPEGMLCSAVPVGGEPTWTGWLFGSGDNVGWLTFVLG